MSVTVTGILSDISLEINYTFACPGFQPVMQMFTLTEDEELDFEAGCVPTPGNQHKTPTVRDQHRSRLAHATPSTSTKMVTTPWLNPLSRYSDITIFH